MGSEAFIIDGKQHAKELEANLKEATRQLRQSHDIQPGLAIIRVGDDPASKLYVSTKGQQAKGLGFSFQESHFSADVKQTEVLECIEDLNRNPSVHGIILQLPLPPHLDRFTLLASILPEKDVDGLHPLNMGKLWTGDTSGLLPCTPQGCMMLLKSVHPLLSGMNALMVGCSALVGRPIAAMMLNEDATVTMAHSLTQGLPELCKKADILVVAIGDPRFIQADWIKPGATVIDVGINRLPSGEIVGDVDFDKARSVAGAITPVPGGVGPMTVSCLMNNTYIAARRALEKA